MGIRFGYRVSPNSTPPVGSAAGVAGGDAARGARRGGRRLHRLLRTRGRAGARMGVCLSCSRPGKRAKTQTPPVQIVLGALEPPHGGLLVMSLRGWVRAAHGKLRPCAPISCRRLRRVHGSSRNTVLAGVWVPRAGWCKSLSTDHCAYDLRRRCRRAAAWWRATVMRTPSPSRGARGTRPAWATRYARRAAHASTATRLAQLRMPCLGYQGWAVSQRTHV